MLVASWSITTTIANERISLGNSMHWHDAPFEEMAARAALIAVVEITNGDAFFSRAKVVESLKGEKPDGPDFLITGYNNTRGNQDWREQETLKTGDRLLAFLNPATQKVKGESSWNVPTPSSGDLRIRDGMLHGDWYSTSWPRYFSGIPLEIGVELVRGLVDHQAKKKPDRAIAIIEKHLTSAAIDAADEESKQKAYGEKSHLLLWLLCAQANYGDPKLTPVITRASKTRAAYVAVGAGRALTSLPNTPENLAAAGRLLKFHNSHAQVEACHALQRWKIDGATTAKLIVPAIDKADTWHLQPKTSLDVVLNTSASGREMMIRTLTANGAGDAPGVEDSVAAFIRFEDGGIDAGVYAALAEHFLKYRSNRARERFLALYRVCPGEDIAVLNPYILKEGSNECIEVAANKILDPGISTYGRGVAVDQFVTSVPAENPIVLKTLNKAREQFPKDDEVAMAAIRANLRDGKESSQNRARKILGEIDTASQTYWPAVNVFTNHFRCGDPVLGEIVSRELDRAEDWQRIPLWVAAAKSVTPEMLAVLKNQKPTLQGDAKKPSPFQTDLLAMLIDFVVLQQDPPANAKEHIDALVALFARDQGGTQFGNVLQEEYHRLATAEGTYAISALRKGLEQGKFFGRYQILSLMEYLGAKLNEQERAALKREQREFRDLESMDRIRRKSVHSPGIQNQQK